MSHHFLSRRQALQALAASLPPGSALGGTLRALAADAPAEKLPLEVTPEEDARVQEWVLKAREM